MKHFGFISLVSHLFAASEKTLSYSLLCLLSIPEIWIWSIRSFFGRILTGKIKSSDFVSLFSSSSSLLFFSILLLFFFFFLLSSSSFFCYWLKNIKNQKKPKNQNQKKYLWLRKKVKGKKKFVYAERSKNKRINTSTNTTTTSSYTQPLVHQKETIHIMEEQRVTEEIQRPERKGKRSRRILTAIIPCLVVFHLLTTNYALVALYR